MDIKEFLQSVYTTKQESQTRDTPPKSIKSEVTEVKTKVEVDRTLYEIFYNVIIEGISTPHTMSVEVPNLGFSYKSHKTDITIAHKTYVAKVYPKGVSASEIYILLEKDEVSIGKFIKIKGIDFTKKVLTSMDISDEDFKNKVTYAIFDMYKSNYGRKKMLEEFEARPSLTKEEFLDYLKNYQINPKAVNKIKFILKTNNVPTKLNARFIDSMLEFYKKGDALTPYDFQFFDFDKGLVEHLKKSRKEIINSVYRYLSDRKQCYPKSVQTYINRYFSGFETKARILQESQDTNPISQLLQGRKVIFTEGETLDNKIEVNVTNFQGIIDPTHSSEQQSNIKNHFTDAIDFKDGDMMVSVLTKDFKEVSIPIAEYLSSPILSYEYIDYKARRITELPSYRCLCFGEYGDFTFDEVKYLRSQKSLVSPSSALTPFANKTMSVRHMYGQHHRGQAIPVVGAKKSIIHTPFVKDAFEKTLSHVKSGVDGTVINIEDNIVQVKTDTGEVIGIAPTKLFKETANHTFNKYRPNVKIGQKVSSDSVVFKLNSFDGDEIALGVPSLVMFGSFYAKENNDSILISKSAAKKFESEEQQIFEIPLYKDRYQLNISEESSDIFSKVGLPKKGTIVNSGETIFTYKRLVYSHENEAAYIFTTLGHQDYYLAKQDIVVPEKIKDGKVIKIEVFPANRSFADSPYQSYLKELEKESSRVYKSLLGDNYAIDKGEARNITSIDAVIRIYVEYLREVTKGDKFSTRYGNKGTISEVMDDNKMPRTKEGVPVDFVMSPLGGASRGINGQMFELGFGSISEELYKRLSAKKYDGLDYVCRTLYPRDFDKGYEYIFNKHKYLDKYMRIEMEPYDTSISADVFNRLLADLNLNGGTRKMVDPITGFTIKNMVYVGVAEVFRLYQIAVEKLKVTPTIKYTSKIHGYGQERKGGGQKLGEQSVIQLHSHGQADYYKELASRYEDKDAVLDNAFLQQMIRIIK